MEEKFLCAIATFDESTDMKFKKIQDELVKVGIKEQEVPPHITLAAYVGVEEEAIDSWIEEFIAKNRKIEVKFSNIGLFGLRVVFIAPYVSDELKDFHRVFHKKYDDACGEIGLNYSLAGGGWIPHVTAFIDEADALIRVLPIINDNFQPFIGEIDKIELYEFYPMRKIKVYAMKK